MKLSVNINIDANKESVWKIITDIDNSVNNISAIEKVEILERPKKGLVGLKWRETRTMFGKTATEDMTIKEYTKNDYYKTHAESHGAIYESKLSVEESNKKTTLTMAFEATPVTFGAKIMYTLMSFMIKGAMVKALQRDVEDIRKVAETL